MTVRQRILFAIASVIGLALALPAPALASIPTPDNDPFYTPPANFEAAANGTVLKEREVSVNLVPLVSTSTSSQVSKLLSTLAPYIKQLKNLDIHSYQVLYKSTDGHGDPVAEAATILVPQGPWNANRGMGGSRPLVAFQSAEDSISTNCQPSYVLRAGLKAKDGGIGSVSQFDKLLSLPALAEGYAVVFADYEGPQSQWLAGKQAAHGVLDGIRAALNYSPAGLTQDTRVALWGYSGGGGATGWAAEQAQTYAPELNIVGAAIGANSNADLANVYEHNNGTTTNGFLPMAFVGLKRAFPNAGVDAYLNAKGKKLLERASNTHACTVQNLIKFSVAGKLEKYTIYPHRDLAKSEVAKRLFKANSLVSQPLTPDMPILSYHDVYDTLIPVKGDNDLMQKYCKAGGQVEILRTATWPPIHGAIHGAGAIEGELPALHYITNRFKGITPRNDCQWPRTWSWGWKIPFHPIVTQ